jgi:hypothetical protein
VVDGGLPWAGWGGGPRGKVVQIRYFRAEVRVQNFAYCCRVETKSSLGVSYSFHRQSGNEFNIRDR